MHTLFEISYSALCTNKTCFLLCSHSHYIIIVYQYESVRVRIHVGDGYNVINPDVDSVSPPFLFPKIYLDILPRWSRPAYNNILAAPQL